MHRRTKSGLIDNTHLTAAAAGASLLTIAVLAGLALTSSSADRPVGQVLPTAVERGTADPDRGDYDLDGLRNNVDPDDDQDGWPDGRDPNPRSGTVVGGRFYVDLDNDGKSNTHPDPALADTDDDNDGTPDLRDRYPLDADNDRIPDYRDKDRDGDGRDDWGEMQRLIFYKAQALGTPLVLGAIRSFSDAPAALLASLQGGVFARVSYDSDNDGLPNQSDPVNNLVADRVRSDSARYGSYEKKWAAYYTGLAASGTPSDWIPREAVLAARQGQEVRPDLFKVTDHSLWRDRYSSEAGETPVGGGVSRDPYRDFYQDRDGQDYERSYKAPPPGSEPTVPPSTPPPSYQPPPPSYQQPPPVGEMPPPPPPPPQEGPPR